jgi:Protein of unknown function (DUF1565)
MNCRPSKLAFFVGLMVSLLTPCSALEEKPAPDRMPTSGVCTSAPADTSVTTEKFYVAVTGSDSNPGTIDLPWRTIQHAADSMDAGETVYIRGGVYNESVDIEVSGSASAGPVTFQSYPGENAILDGAGLTPPANDIRGLINIEDESYVTVRGLEIRNYQTAHAAATPSGIWVTGGGSHIQILNNLVHNIGTAAEASGNALGIGVYGTASTAALDSITISDNQLHDLKTGSSESVTVNGNVTNFSINCNIIHDVDNIGIAAVGFEEVAPDPALDYARNGTISRNILYDITARKNPAEHNEYNADGISVDGGSQVTIESNLLYNVDIGIEIASQHKGRSAHDVIARNNLVYHTNSVGITIGGYNRNVGGADHCTIVNNTLFQNDTRNTGSGEFQIQYYATNNVFKNNVVSANSQGLFINDYTKEGPEPADLDYNLYFSPVSESNAEFVWRGKDHEGFPAYQKAAGRDQHSKYADQKVLSLETIDPRVHPASLAVNPGIVSDAAANDNLNFAAENQHLTALLENSEEVPYPMRSRPLPYVLPDSGFYANVSQATGHDSFAGYSGELDLSVGYDFGRALEVESGLPFYFLSATNISTPTDANHFSYRYSSFGDAFVKIAVSPFARLDYLATLTVTAPTGTANVSTGQATWDWNNRVENDWWHFHPFGEFVLGNVPSITPRLESYRISGSAAQVHAGNTFDLGKLGSFDASFYESVPLGNATAYFDSAAEAPSTPFNLLSDHGFNGDFSRSAGRFAFDVTYNRSIAHSANAVYVTLGYRIGHLRRERVQ